MPENLRTAEGTILEDVPLVGDEQAQAAFKQAMSAPEATDPVAPAPPPKDPDAPYGRTKDGRPKKGPGGRPPKGDKADQPRVQTRKPPAPARDFTEDLTGIVQLGWGMLVATSPADAAALKLHGPNMVTAWNQLAQENAQVAKGITWLTTGTAYGAVVMATAPLILQVLSNHGRLPHDRLASLGLQDPDALARMTAADVAEMQQAAPAAA